MNIGGGTSFNQMLEQEIKLDSTDSRLSSQFPLTPHWLINELLDYWLTSNSYFQ